MDYRFEDTVKIELNDKQIKILLECLGNCHAVEHMKGKSAPHLASVIVEFGNQLKQAGKMDLFESVFEEVGKSI